MSKDYEQYCPLAHALGVVGERWTLLVVRDLLHGPKRYTDLAAGLPGIGTNILAARLRDLDDAGVIQKRRLPPPAAVNVYELTPYGEELREPLYALGRWGARSLGPPGPRDALAPGWLVNAVQATCREWEGRAKGTFELHAGEDEVVTVSFENGKPVAEPGTSDEAGVVIETDPTTLFCIASRDASIEESIASGDVRIRGDRADAKRFLSLFSFDKEPRRSGELEHV
jgi:DNA-binding HxlR family transcriptional regulator